MLCKKLVLAALLCVFIAAPAWGLESGDNQIWYTQTVQGDLSDAWGIQLEQEFRFGDDAGALCEEFTELGLACQLTEGFQLGFGFRQVHRLHGNAWMSEKRPVVTGTLTWNWWGIAFSDRNRLEQRLFTGPASENDEWQYRNRVTATLPQGLTAAFTQPYAACEAFLDPIGGDTDLYRVSVGLVGPIAEYAYEHRQVAIVIDLGYMKQIAKIAKAWHGDNILRLGLQAKF